MENILGSIKDTVYYSGANFILYNAEDFEYEIIVRYTTCG